MTENTISIQGREIPVSLSRIDINQLRFYPDNPRINYIISTHDGEVTQEVIEAKLLSLDSTKDLLKDIEENQGLLEEILVLKNEVIEGNTRLAIYRQLARKHMNDPRWETIPCKLLPADTKDEELFFILGTFHIKGKNEWSAFEKAAFIHRMIRELNYSEKDMAKQFGHHVGTISAITKAYETMRDKYLPMATKDKDDFEVQDALKKYSYFEVLYHQKDLAKRANETPQFIDSYCDWVYKDVFKKAEAVRDTFPKVLNSKLASRCFFEMVDTEPEEAFYEAVMVLTESKPEQVDPFYRGVKTFRDLLAKAPVDEIKADLETDGPRAKACRISLVKCRKDIINFCKRLGLE